VKPAATEALPGDTMMDRSPTPLPPPQETSKQDKQSGKIAVCLMECMQSPADSVANPRKIELCGGFLTCSA